MCKRRYIYQTMIPSSHSRPRIPGGRNPFGHLGADQKDCGLWGRECRHLWAAWHPFCTLFLCHVISWSARDLHRTEHVRNVIAIVTKTRETLDLTRKTKWWTSIQSRWSVSSKMWNFTWLKELPRYFSAFQLIMLPSIWEKWFEASVWFNICVYYTSETLSKRSRCLYGTVRSWLARVRLGCLYSRQKKGRTLKRNLGNVLHLRRSLLWKILQWREKINVFVLGVHKTCDLIILAYIVKLIYNLKT